MNGKFSGQTALVTGAGSGIGQATAVALAELGFRVALIGRDSSKLEATRNLLPAEIAETTVIASCDVADREGVNAAVAEVLEDFGRLDVLVCNAGTNVRNRTMEVLTPDDWDLMINTNLTGAFNLVHACLPTMRTAKSGLIVQICSISGVRPSLLGGIGYTASKFGQGAFGMTLAREVGPLGIRSTVIHPGEVNTPILANRPVKVEDARKQVMLQPEDVAAAVKFLVELNPRAHIVEMIIKPTVDDFA